MYSIFRQFSVFFANIIKVRGNQNSLIANILQNISFCVSQKTEWWLAKTGMMVSKWWL